MEDTVSLLTDTLGLPGSDGSDGSKSAEHNQQQRRSGSEAMESSQKAGQQPRHADDNSAGYETGEEGSGEGPSLADLGDELSEAGSGVPDLGGNGLVPGGGDGLVPGAGKEGLLPGVCLGADLDGDAPCPNTEFLGGDPLELCLDDAKFGSMLPEQLGVTCVADEEGGQGEQPAPSEPPHQDEGGDKREEPTVMPPPRHRAQPAEPAEPVSAQPVLTG